MVSHLALCNVRLHEYTDDLILCHTILCCLLEDQISRLTLIAILITISSYHTRQRVWELGFRVTYQLNPKP